MKFALCVVGCGDFARTFAKAMAPLRSEIDLYFASRDAKRAESYAKEFDGVDAFGSYRTAAADPRVAAMYLCTPHHLHMEHSLIAARAGKHILVEKPMALNLLEGREMLTQARRAGVTFMVAENYRYMATVRSAKTLTCDGAIGDLRMIQLQEEAFFNPTSWRDNPEENGGGVLIDGGIHKVDMLIYLAGMPEQVFATALPRALPGVGGEDGAVVMTRSPDGVVGIINHSWTPSKHPNPPWVTISGAEGQIHFEIGAPRLKLTNRSGEQTLRYENDYHGLVPMVREFRDSIREQRQPITSGSAGIGALTVVLKAYESMDRGVAVPIG
ncbi:MAG: hypothetical protein BZY75_04070 [SAR202 cluster bacterium Io17-Chloro-G7]|nr:MAG: hypothetical protein BZY75_04070 [SAR202 cluster bacterium Io17-Chloro-G7]